MDCFDRLADRVASADSLLCVGLDPDPDRLPAAVADHDLPRWAFNRRIIDATAEHAAAFKPNAAFYEDPDGWRALEETLAYAEGTGVPVILDAKRADIGNTARQYAKLLDRVDAITANPYMGEDSLQPFLSHESAATFVLCRTSNPGGADLQSLELEDGGQVYERVADLASEWDDGNVGLVVGATAPDELEEVRERVPELPFLVPGVGAQGGDVEAAVEHGVAASGPYEGVGLVNSTRGIIFSWEDAHVPEDEFAKAAGSAAATLKRRLNEYR
ncbi:orotidine-5'-phosphate decarboxylase [Salinarchaeum laminariae]|uniref:orotidine-5'-phosphate decarboxylase n=1 Tax=Salinarchaeum laminariae TaxID=869888 RepID=UPI0020C167AB|nr:orotidine-5'-phosphate decarboxylase [Salinarchaeum laminariae]